MTSKSVLSTSVSHHQANPLYEIGGTGNPTPIYDDLDGTHEAYDNSWEAQEGYTVLNGRHVKYDTAGSVGSSLHEIRFTEVDQLDTSHHQKNLLYETGDQIPGILNTPIFKNTPC